LLSRSAIDLRKIQEKQGQGERSGLFCLTTARLCFRRDGGVYKLPRSPRRFSTEFFGSLDFFFASFFCGKTKERRDHNVLLAERIFANPSKFDDTDRFTSSVGRTSVI
jgi:hypothetical protein